MTGNVWMLMKSVDIAIPHAVIEDDEYRGWGIPKGSTV
jgi:hypothetical protein